MNFKTLLILSVLAASTYIAGAADPDKPTVIASVRDIMKNESPLTEGTTIFFVVHSPQRLCGAQINIVVAPESRKSVRTRFPIGSLQTLHLAASAMETIARQLEPAEHIQRELDAGAPIGMISQIVLPLEVPVASLLSPPKPFHIPK